MNFTELIFVLTNFIVINVRLTKFYELYIIMIHHSYIKIIYNKIIFMKNQNLKEKIDEIFKKDERFWDSEREVLLRNTISDYAEKFDEKFLKMLLLDETAKEHFFRKVGKIIVFDKEKFLAYINNKDFLENSYTKFTQNIGLTDKGQFLKSAGKVVLHWPYKDCILEGGQTKEDTKRNEIFFNEILEKDEIDVLLKPKVFSKFEKFSLKNKKVKGEKFEKWTRDENGTIKNNLIVKGNNLIVLHSLKEEFAGKVKLIYIDPPYNTGNDGFKYNDNFNHSSWLTFMKNRLEVARDLLADDGVIFMQIDNSPSNTKESSELGYLLVLMDEIFGRKNYVSSLIWMKKGNASNTESNIGTITENILMYSKNFDSLSFNLQDYKRNYKHEDDKQNYNLEQPLKTNRGTYKRMTMLYGIKTDEGVFYPPKNKRWTIGEDVAKKYVSENKYEIIDGKFYIKKYPENYKKGEFKLYNNLLLKHGSLKSAKNELSGLGFNREEFDSPKPEILIQRILEMATKENDLVLDFFAGSGTSGAVAHKMGRQYILVEQMDYIKDLPEARIRKVIEGEQGGISKAVNWKGGGEFVYMEMKEFNQEFLTAIKKARSKEELKKIYDDIQEKAFLSYRFTDERFKAKILEFDELDLNEQKQILAEILDKNLLYLSYSEMEDAKFKISKKDIKVNDNFYGKE